jgi:KRAB domain-containing zinc finger protein
VIVIEASQTVCPKCQIECPTHDDLKIHVADAHSHSRKFECEVCGQAFKYVKNLYDHKLKKHNSTEGVPTSRPRGPYKKTRDSGIIRGEGPFICEHCAKVCANQNILKRHQVQMHQTERPFHCPNPSCEQKFKIKDDLRRHLGSSRCSYVAKTRELKLYEDKLNGEVKSLMDRLLTQVENKVLREEKSGENRTEGVERSNRRWSRYPVDVGPLETDCKLCKKTFSETASLRKHVYFVHSKERPFKCQNCGNGFKRNDDLKKHMRSKKGCGVWEEDSRRRTVAVVKETNEDGEKVLVIQKRRRKKKEPEGTVCEECDMTFSGYYELKRHVATIHSTERPFSCSGCFASFKRNDDLLKHKRRRICGNIHADDDSKERSSSESESEDGNENEENSRKSPAKKKSRLNSVPLIVEPRTFTRKSAMRKVQSDGDQNGSASLMVEVTENDPKDPEFTIESEEEESEQEVNLSDSDYDAEDDLESGRGKTSNKCKASGSYACPDCDNTFPRWLYLKHHIQTKHSETKDFECSGCGKKFKRSYDLRKHKSETQGCGPSFEEETAGARSSITSSLTSAINKIIIVKRRRRRTKEYYEDLSCKDCGKTFNFIHSLKRHMVTVHSSERPFKCPNCAYSSKRSDDLRKHVVKCSKKKLVRAQTTVSKPDTNTLPGRPGPKSSKENDAKDANKNSTLSDKYFNILGGREVSVSLNRIDDLVDGGKTTKKSPRHRSNKRLIIQTNYDCDMCSETFRKKDEMEMHVKQRHKNGAGSSALRSGLRIKPLKERIKIEESSEEEEESSNSSSQFAFGPNSEEEETESISSEHVVFVEESSCSVSDMEMDDLL